MTDDKNERESFWVRLGYAMAPGLYAISMIAGMPPWRAVAAPAYDSGDGRAHRRRSAPGKGQLAQHGRPSRKGGTMTPSVLGVSHVTLSVVDMDAAGRRLADAGLTLNHRRGRRTGPGATQHAVKRRHLRVPPEEHAGTAGTGGSHQRRRSRTSQL